MISMLIGVGVLFLAVVLTATIDPWPQPPCEDVDDSSPTIEPNGSRVECACSAI
jgi:hypothetical protein